MKNWKLFSLLLLTSKTLLASPALNAFNAKDIDKAKSLFEEQLSKKENLNESYFYLGRIALMQGRLDDAEDLLEEAIEQEPNSADEHYWFGAMSGMQAQEASIFTAGSYIGDLKEHFRKAIELEPSHLEAHKGLLQFYLQAPSIVGGSIEEAQKLVPAIHHISPLEGDLAQLTIVQKSEDTEAINHQIETIEKNHGQDPRALFRCGLAYQGLKNFSSAYNTFSKLAQFKINDDNKYFV